MDKNRIIAAAILALSIVILGLFVKVSVDNCIYSSRVVTVKGLSEIEVPADRVIYPLVFKEIGNNLQEIYFNVNKKNAIIVDYLKSKGIPQEDISIAAPEIVDLQAERYVSENINYRYNVTSVITINSSEIDKVKHVMLNQTDLINKDVALVSGDYRYEVSYEFTKLNDVKPQMIEDATKNARAAAEKFAADSESKLGKIKSASQGQFSITNKDMHTPEIKHVRVVTNVVYYLED